MQKHIKNIIERHRYNVVHPNDGLRPQKNCQSFYYRPERWRDTTCSKTVSLPLHALTISLTQSQILFTMLSFIGEIQWENSRVNLIPWVHKTVGHNISQKIFMGGPPPNPQGRENECTVHLGYKHDWIISMDLEY